MMSDSIAVTLFNQEPPIVRLQMERKLRLRVREFWRVLKARSDAGEISEAGVERRLGLLDQWLDGRLSGQNVLSLARDAEIHYPEWISYMPRLLSMRYEELRVARLWSALLNPNALGRLRKAIEAEKQMGALGDMSELSASGLDFS